MDDSLKERISRIGNDDAVKLYFRLLKILIDELDLSPENPKLALTVPKGQSHIVANLNSRYALVLQNDSSISFMVNKKEFRLLQKKIKSDDHGQFSKGGKDDAYFANYSFAKLKNEDVLSSVVEAWLKCCREFEPQMSKSPYRKFHNEELFSLAMDESKLNAYLESEVSPLKYWIDQYKKLIEGKLGGSNYNELYKWETIQHFQDNWSDEHDESNIVDLLKRSFNKENNNLWSGQNYYPYRMLLEFGEKNPARTSDMFRKLFDEETPLEGRLKYFQSSAEEIKESIYPGQHLSHHQSDRAILVYLSMRYPDKYFLYKSRMFKTFCELTGFWQKPAKTKTDKYSVLVSYNEMCLAVRQILLEDKALIQTHLSRLPGSIKFSDDYHVLTQDFIYAVTQYLSNRNTHSLEEMERLFREYLESVRPDSVRNYMSAIPTVTRIALKEDLVQESIYEIQTIDKVDKVLEELKDVDEYKERNRVGHNMFSSAMSKYREFLEKLDSVDKTFSSDTMETSRSLNQIFFGPPGTGKTFNTIDAATTIVTGRSLDHKANKIEFDRLRAEGQIEFVTFHQNYSYEDFMVGIKPDIENSTLRFVPYKGIFYELCKRARGNYEASKAGGRLVDYADLVNRLLLQITDEQPLELKTATGRPFWLTDSSDRTIYFKKSNGNEAHSLSIATLIEIAENKREMKSGLAVYYYPIVEYLNKDRKVEGSSEELKNYVLIIDEINRANISKVFGELITLLEEDKRLDGENELRITLPNGEKDFAVPPNLYLIGTMNTADKSIALVDIALRRRFEFVGKYPDYRLISNKKASRLLKEINEAVYLKKESADFLIGHAYFMNDRSIEDNIRNKIIPLLSEYFMGRKDFVEAVFEKTSWSATYNSETFAWDVAER